MGNIAEETLCLMGTDRAIVSIKTPDVQDTF